MSLSTTTAMHDSATRQSGRPPVTAMLLTTLTIVVFSPVRTNAQNGARFRPDTYYDPEQQIRYRLIDREINGVGGAGITRTDAHNFAVFRGTSLVAIGNSQQNSFVGQIAQTVGHELWIGLAAPACNLVGVPAAYTWSSPPLIGNDSYRNWGPNEPFDTNECSDSCDRYVVISPASDHRWNNTVNNPNAPCYSALFWGVEATYCVSSIIEQPTSVSTCASGAATFSVGFIGNGPITLQWQVADSASPNGWTNISDGTIFVEGGMRRVGVFSGSQTPLLHADGFYVGPDFPIISVPVFVRCVVTNECRSVPTDTAALSVSQCDCLDFNNDTSVFDPIDIDAFLSVYGEGPCVPSEATCGDIDFNNDTSVFDPCDIGSFLTVYSEGPCTPCGT